MSIDKITSVQIKVPATSANCGPGFDCLGIAVTMYNTFTYELLPQGKLELQVEGEGAGKMQASPHNLAFASFFKLWQELQQNPVGLKISMVNAIPLSRGLGSSSSAIVAGLMAANFFAGFPKTKEELVKLATAIEGHPDNVAPALLGGFTISFMDHENRAHTMRLIPAKPLQLIAAIPQMPLATAKARAALPATIPLADGVFSMSRASLLVACLLTGDYSKLPLALEDKLHQPYRLSLIPGAEAAFKAARTQGAYQAIISGAGSTLMAYAPLEAEGAAIGHAMEAALAANHNPAVALNLTIDLEGAKVL